jgi:phosphoribosyl 1,2-cyclic phosphodiesterase
MAVYVDVPMHRLGRMIMCHMTADSTQELLAMADKIGVARKWIQHAGHPYKEHFDIAKSKRALAVTHGAIELNTIREAAAHIARRKERARNAAAD